MNALKHGLSAKSIVIGDENPEDFEALRDAVISHYRPSSALATDAADRYAATLWRLRRIPAIEAALAEAACRQAHAEECAEQERQYNEELNEEASQRCCEAYGNDEDRIYNALRRGEHQRKWSQIRERARQNVHSKHRK